MSERLKPLNDFVFKKLFGEDDSIELLENFLSAILGYDVTNIDIVGENLTREKIDDKQGILDIKAIQSETGEKINIEVQLINHNNMIERTLFYWSKLYTENFKKGEEYGTLKRTITINILDFNFLPTKKFHSTYQISEVEEKIPLTDTLEIHFIEYPKFKKSKQDMNNSLDRWLLFLQEDVSKEILEEVIELDNVIEIAQSKLKRLSEDEETKRNYELREKELSDKKSQLKTATVEGEMKSKKEIAKNLFKKFESFSVIDVAEVVDLPLDVLKDIEKDAR